MSCDQTNPAQTRCMTYSFRPLPGLGRSRKGTTAHERAGRPGPALDEGGCPTGQVPEYTSRFSREGSNAEWVHPTDARIADTQPHSDKRVASKRTLVNRTFLLAGLSSACGIVAGSRPSRNQSWMRNGWKEMKTDCWRKRAWVLKKGDWERLLLGLGVRRKGRNS